MNAESPASTGPVMTSLFRLLSTSPTRAVMLCCVLGAIFEWLPVAQPLRFFSAPPAAAKKINQAEPAVELGVGSVELQDGSQSQEAMAIPRGDQAPSRGPIGGHEAPLDLPAINAEPPPVPLENPTGHALDHFFAALSRTQHKVPGAVTRITHFGDSVIVSDYVSGTLRQKLQATFGDAGHGYMLIANAWPAYFHNDVFRFATKGFSVSRIVGPLAKDGLHGLGGVTFSASRGAIAQFGTAEKGEFGRNVAHFELSYLAQPDGGSFEVWVDGKVAQEVDTAAPTKEARQLLLEVPDGEHRFELRHARGTTRTFGVVLERKGPGVVLDALGIQGARIRFLDKQDDAHLASELKWRRPDLVTYQFGANESGDGYAYPMDEYLRTMKLVITQGQAALPNASCLIIGAMDRARVENGIVTSMRIIQLIVEQQQRAARELGCAYFDTYRAMGGWGSMPNWVKRGLGQADMTHPSGVGAIRLGNWIYQALMDEYARYLKQMRKDVP